MLFLGGGKTFGRSDVIVGPSLPAHGIALAIVLYNAPSLHIRLCQRDTDQGHWPWQFTRNAVGIQTRRALSIGVAQVMVR